MVRLGDTAGAIGRVAPAEPASTDAPPPGGVVVKPGRVVGNPAVALSGIGPNRALVLQCRCFLTECEPNTGAFDPARQSRFPQDRRPARTMIDAVVRTPGAPVGADCVAHRPAAGGAA